MSAAARRAGEVKTEQGAEGTAAPTAAAYTLIWRMGWELMGKSNPWTKAEGWRPTAGPPLHASGEQIVSGLMCRYSLGRCSDIPRDHHNNRNSICKPSCQIGAYSLAT